MRRENQILALGYAGQSILREAKDLLLAGTIEKLRMKFMADLHGICRLLLVCTPTQGVSPSPRVVLESWSYGLKRLKSSIPKGI